MIGNYDKLRQASAGWGRSALSFRCPAPTCHWAGCSTSMKCVLLRLDCRDLVLKDGSLV